MKSIMAIDSLKPHFAPDKSPKKVRDTHFKVTEYTGITCNLYEGDMVTYKSSDGKRYMGKIDGIWGHPDSSFPKVSFVDSRVFDFIIDRVVELDDMLVQLSVGLFEISSSVEVFQLLDSKNETSIEYVESLKRYAKTCFDEVNYTTVHCHGMSFICEGASSYRDFLGKPKVILVGGEFSDVREYAPEYGEVLLRPSTSSEIVMFENCYGE